MNIKFDNILRMANEYYLIQLSSKPVDFDKEQLRKESFEHANAMYDLVCKELSSEQLDSNKRYNDLIVEVDKTFEELRDNHGNRQFYFKRGAELLETEGHMFQKINGRVFKCKLCGNIASLYLGHISLSEFNEEHRVCPNRG